MNWIAVLLSLASLGGSPAPGEAKPRKQCTAAKSAATSAAPKKDCKAKQKTKTKSKKKSKPKSKQKPAPKAQPRDEPTTGTPGAQRDPDSPSAQPGPETNPQPTPTPAATATPVPTATPAPPGTHPTRTNVDLDEWLVRPSYRILAAGPIEFNVNNRGEDDHNLEVRAGDRQYGRIDLAPSESGTMTLDLWLGTYTLYCSLPDHEEAGMRATISVR